jgi:hypothetical protein
MKILLIGIAAAGGKAVVDAIDRGVIYIDDTILINSTTKDIPK